ncbi:ArsR/SmtB family transcription factor [Aquibium microcysteis]|uniref:ArsR/SmtB family transcription factor n=1 Tax=Aquibium microcysteis TaxID=675281 RepID=UPI00165D2115
MSQASRLGAVRALANEAELSVGELAAKLSIPTNTMSTHLAILRDAGLLHARRDGRTVHYSLKPEALEELVVWLKKSA